MYKISAHSAMNIDLPDSRRSSKSTVTSRFSDRPREKVRLHEVEQTLLPTLLWRALDAQHKAPVLGDPYAGRILDRLEDLDLEGTYGADERWVRYVAGRARRIDDWTAEFLDCHAGESVTVLHLACGLDARDLRVPRDPETVRWVDVDRPLVANLRERVFAPGWGGSSVDLSCSGMGCGDEPPPSSSSSSSSLRPYGDYSLRSLNVTEGRWYSDIPADRPTLIIAEGLFPFLAPDEAERVIGGLLDYFGRGTLVFDTVGSLAVNHTKRANLLKPSGSKFQWGVDDARTVLGIHPKLRLMDEVRWYEFMGVEISKDNSPPWFGPKTMTLAQFTSSFKDNGQVLRFEF